MSVRALQVIGERINPSGKPGLIRALQAGEGAPLIDLAQRQAQAGADWLDVNVHCSGVSERALLPWAAALLEEAVDVPLVLDSADAEALIAGLRACHRKAVLNSVRAEERSLSRLLPLAAEHGAAVIGLPLDENGLPQSAEACLRLAEKIVSAALRHGMAREDVWIDCLALPGPERTAETLRTLSRVRRQLGVHTVLGISNVSYGQADRLAAERDFLARALDCGLTRPILNPNKPELMDLIRRKNEQENPI